MKKPDFLTFITRQAIGEEVFRSVQHLEATVATQITNFNEHAKAVPLGQICRVTIRHYPAQMNHRHVTLGSSYDSFPRQSALSR